MASITKRPDGKWRARWRETPGGPQKARHFDRKMDAERFLDGVRGDLVRGTYVDPRAGLVTFGEFAEAWRARQVHRPSTVDQVESYLRLHAYPTFGDRPLVSIRQSELQAWVKGRCEVLAPGSVHLAFRWVSTIFKTAVQDQLIVRSPCTGVKLPKQNRKPIVALEVTQVEALAAAVPERYRALILFAAGTGLRQGELFGLTVDRVDFLRKTVTVDRQLSGVAAGEPTFGPPKSPAGFRTVPFGQIVIDELAAHLARWPVGKHGLVFTNTEGRPLRRSTFGDMWGRARRTAGLPDWATCHDLRHFYVSLLIARGCSVKTVQVVVGHDSAIETLDSYGHWWPDSDDEVREAVDLVLGVQRGGTDMLGGPISVVDDGPFSPQLVLSRSSK
jgi:integrase